MKKFYQKITLRSRRAMALALDLINNNSIKEETYYVPKTRKVLVAAGGAV